MQQMHFSPTAGAAASKGDSYACSSKLVVPLLAGFPNPASCSRDPVTDV